MVEDPIVIAKPLCGAKTRSGTPCQRAPMPNGRCYLHGGKTPSGIASPHFKHGRYSRALGGILASHYQHAQQDEDWLSLREEIHLVDAELQQLIEADYPAHHNRILRLIEQRRKLVDTERRRLRDAHGMIPVERVRGVVRMIIEVIRKHVRDERALRSIQRDLDRLT